MSFEFGILSDEISLNLDEALREGSALGFRKYEIRCIDSYEERVPYFKKEYEDRLVREVEEGNIEVTAISPGLFKIKLSETEKLEKQLHTDLPKTCELAVRMKCPIIIVFGFLTEEGGNRDEVIRHLSEAGKITASYGLKLAVENEPGAYCDTGERTAAIVKAIDQPDVGINWDPANAISCYEPAYPIGYEAVKPYLLNVHIKDQIPLPPDKWENRLIGDGGMNWVGQLRALKRDKILPHLTLETHVFPLLESTHEDMRRLKILMQTVDAFDSGSGDPA